jgi:hypothetical protein
MNLLFPARDGYLLKFSLGLPSLFFRDFSTPARSKPFNQAKSGLIHVRVPESYSFNTLSIRRSGTSHRTATST